MESMEGDEMSENLCTVCTMCCNGMLFAEVVVTEEERRRLGGGPAFSTGADGPRIPQGCRFLGEGGACRHYAERPANCRAYRCDLLRNVEAGTLDEAFAKGVVAQAKAFHRRVVESCEAATPDAFWREGIADASDAIRATIHAKASGAPVAEHLYREAVFHWNVCCHYMRKHFQADYCDETPEKRRAA